MIMVRRFAILILMMLLCVDWQTSRFPNLSIVETAHANRGSRILAAAQKKFAQGDIVATKSLLSKNVGSLKGRDQSEAYKLLGVCNYLIGQKGSARDAFEAALRLNPRATLPQKYILDPGIAGFFQGIRLAKSRSASPPPQRRSARSRRATPPAKAASAPVRKGATGIFVRSNAKGSTVFANGLFVGTSDQFIELKPGRYKLAISAAGYNPASQTISISKGQQIQVKVRLESPEEIRKRKLAAAKAARRKALAAKALSEKRARQAEEQKRKRAASAQARELARLEAAERSRAAKKGSTSKLYGDSLPKGKHSLADEFRADQRKAAPNPQPQPKPAPPQQRTVQPGANPYAGAPPPPYPPNTAQANPYRGSSAYPPPYPGTGPGAPAARQARSKSTFLAVLPFGSGQFQNGDHVLGAVLAAAQVGAIGYGTYLLLEATNHEAAYKADLAANPERYTEIDIAENDEYVQTTKTNSQIAFLVFGGIWAIGAVEALVSINSHAGVAHNKLTQPSSSQQDTQKKNPSAFRWSPTANLESKSLGLALEYRF